MQHLSVRLAAAAVGAAAVGVAAALAVAGLPAEAGNPAGARTHDALHRGALADHAFGRHQLAEHELARQARAGREPVHRGLRVTGPEVISGAVSGRAANSNDPHIPLHLHGLVRGTDRGFVLGSGGGRDHAILTPAGTLRVRITGKPVSAGTGSPRTCRETYTEDQTFRVLGDLSTGAFTRSAGVGAVQIFFAAFAPRHHAGAKKGRCNFNGRPHNHGAIARFLATIVLTIRR